MAFATLAGHSGGSMSFYDFTVKKADGSEFALDECKGQVVLVVNVASQCGFTPQYEGLQNLHEKYKDQGLRVIGFPCNQFARQEPGDNSAIQQFCSLNFGVTFPILAKVDVNGVKAEPLYEYLKSSARGVLFTKSIKWNFTKFLVGRDGRVLKRYSPRTKPEDIGVDIEAALRS